MIETSSLMPGRLFPERLVTIRGGTSLRQFKLSTAVQLALIGVMLASASAAGFTTYRSNSAQHQLISQLNADLAAEHQAAELARHALAVLADSTGAEPSSATADTKSLASAVADRITGLEQKLAAATHQQDTAQSQREQLAAEKGKLQAKLGAVEGAKSKSEHDLAAEREQLRIQVNELEKRLKRSGHLPSHVIIPGQQIESSSAGPETGSANLASSANLDSVMSRLGIGMRSTKNAGGPYVALNRGKESGTALDAETKAIMKSLPLAAPLDHYEFESGFGERTDPMNGNEAMHTGVDLSAPYRSPVHSTAAGEVVFAGYAAGYGKMVEIDHGQGIHTRYAHLNRLMANLGQHVEKHAVIGLLGSSGRSTGPHVHYEVLVNGVAQNPQRFLNAGRAAAVVDAAD